MTDEDILEDILVREGGFVDNPADPGGITFWGVTLPAMTDYLGRKATRADILALTRNEAKEIHRKQRLAPFLKIGPAELRAILVDFATLHGVSGATKILQRVLRTYSGAVLVDGVLGPKTIGACDLLPWKCLAIQVLGEQTRTFGRSITHNLRDRDHDGIPDNVEFAAGWTDRNADMLDRIARTLTSHS